MRQDCFERTVQVIRQVSDHKERHSLFLPALLVGFCLDRDKLQSNGH
jgi:hypothetical protein